jgi:hypothetical protein
MRAATSLLSIFLFLISASSARAELAPMKEQCEALGYRPKTEKFGDCVMELYSRSVSRPSPSSTRGLSAEAHQCIQMGFKLDTSEMGACQIQLKQLAIQQNQFETQRRAYDQQMSAAQKQRDFDQAQALFGIANQSLGIAGGGRQDTAIPPGAYRGVLPPPVPPLRVIPPSGSPFICSYQGSTLVCR